MTERKEQGLKRLGASIGRLANGRIAQGFLRSARLFAALSLTWLLVILLLSVYELLINRSVPGMSAEWRSLLFHKLSNDILYWLSLYLWMLIPVGLAGFFSLRAARWVGIVLLLLMIIIQFMLIKYFSTALVMLGADLYSYSWKDIKQTVGASGSLHASLFIIGILFLSALAIGINWVARNVRVGTLLTLVFPLLSLGFIIAGSDSWFGQGRFSSEFMANLAVNKPDHFIRASWWHFFPPDQEVDIYADNYNASEDAGGLLATRFTYPDPEHYPFFHEDSTKDVLSPFFTPSKTPPHIVIILVEGLGRAFTAEGAYLGNFTPFVDSLARQSLYWKNFLSEGGRTFAVLPSILGSLPFAHNGFLELGPDMPPHISLISVLKKNGYHSSFYYGGDAHFDNMDLFLKKDGIDELNDGKTFPPGYTKLPANNGFSWGYNDAALFRRFLSTRDDHPTQPQLSVILTVSTHSPFKINEPEKYGDLFEKRMDELGFDEASKNEHRSFRDQYVSILYTDDAIRHFFEEYAKRPDYKNTIFLITGDHRMPEIPMRTKIDRYHVPLIIFSPLLSRTADFLSISTHFDITPSLLAFLTQAYGLHKPSGSQWMGSGLDTSRGFRNIHAYPLIQTKTDLLDFIAGDDHLNGTQVFRIGHDMNEEPVSDEAEKARLQNGFEAFLRKNDRLAAGGKLIPDSLVAQ